MLVTQKTLRPTRKVTAMGITGLLSAVSVAVINHYVPCSAEIVVALGLGAAGCIGDVIGPQVAGFVVTGAATAAGWLTKERK